MELYDISKGILSAPVYPGDPKPKRVVITSTENGDDYTLSSLTLSSHSATHIDAPSHVIEGGMTVDEIPLYKTTGLATVCSYSGTLDVEGAKALLSSLIGGEPSKRIILRGDIRLTEGGALSFARAGVLLLGVEDWSVGDLSVHRALLSSGVIILEGLSLAGVPDGHYMLSASPLLIEGADGAPCRAILHKI